MDATERARLRALCSVDDDPVRVLRADLADVLDALDAAERERDALRDEVARGVRGADHDRRERGMSEAMDLTMWERKRCEAFLAGCSEIAVAACRRCRELLCEGHRAECACTWADTPTTPDVVPLVDDRRAPAQRPGQALFNALLEVDPGAAEWIRGGELDPFHDDRRIPALLAWWRSELRDDKRIAEQAPQLLRETGAAMEREACAEIADAYAALGQGACDVDRAVAVTAEGIARSIRARGKGGGA